MEIVDKDLSEVIKYCKDELSEVFSSMELDATISILIEHFLGMAKTEVILNPDKVVTDEDYQLIVKAISFLKTNVPLAYVLGEWEFFGLHLKVNKNTLIPRPETEELVYLIIEENLKKDPIHILDIGTGSGCIALALKANIPQSTVCAWDISEKALEKVKENAVMNDLSIEIKQVDILKEPSFDRKLDIVVSNPPYITEKEKELMSSNVLDFEPHLALFVENDTPLIFYEAIANFAKNNLKETGKLYFEINEHYGEEVRLMLEDKDFKEVTILKDINEKDRMVKCFL